MVSLGALRRVFCLLTFITRSHQEGPVSFLTSDAEDKGRLTPAVSSLQVSAFGDGVLCRFLLHRGKKVGPRTFCLTESLLLETKFVEVGGARRWVLGCGGWGRISFYSKQTWLTDGDWPHCGQTLEQLVIWLLHVQNAANLRPLRTKLIKGNRLWWILFPLLCETVCHLSNAHKDGKAADRRCPYMEALIWTSGTSAVGPP